jgi:hypothetical protein
MLRLKPGDRVNCRVREGAIVSPVADYDEIRTFEVVAIDADGCFLFVPAYYSIKLTSLISERQIKKHCIDSRFLNEEMTYVVEDLICQVIDRLDGISCSICKEFFPMATGNQDDGTLICFTCRQNRYH